MTGHPADQAVQAFWEETADLFSFEPGRVNLRAPRSRLVLTVAEALIQGGMEQSSIHINARLHLPGSYDGLSQRWDILVIDDGFPVAAIDLRALTGSGSTNNRANRMKEIVGQSINVARAYAHPSVEAFRPALGQALLLEETDQSTTPRKRQSDLANFQPMSVLDELGAFFRRLRSDGQYDAVWYLTARNSPDAEVREPDPEMGLTAFVSIMIERIAAVREARDGQGLSAADLGELLTQRDDLKLGRTIAEREDVAGVVAGISSVDSGRVAVDFDVIQRRRQIVAELRQLILNSNTTETEIQKMIGKRYWIFGGQYVGVLERRQIITLDEYDVPLICADRSIHIIELKRPKHKLVREHRNHQIVSNEVHEAVAQCMNYVRGFDELGAAHQTYYHNELGLDLDFRRARGTVIIGHPELSASDEVSREQIEQTIRSYNAHLSRVQVITFADLVDSAERALAFEAEEHS
ncbi:Shedu anti-phage system protein SduA domain-containing protein [Amycolatopsis thailandensis]|uniref:Shedu anti-phage system protein SduA domain-containing protein n=1 Tax=Amycolatopsis thailandensis TaxID=589330 RepID=UPI00142D2AC4|nr:Shedu anti-phage system protein SduA domain-containing protein [Amycolatopsis thailandensis]